MRMYNAAEIAEQSLSHSGIHLGLAGSSSWQLGLRSNRIESNRTFNKFDLHSRIEFFKKFDSYESVECSSNYEVFRTLVTWTSSPFIKKGLYYNYILYLRFLSIANKLLLCAIAFNTFFLNNYHIKHFISHDLFYIIHYYVNFHHVTFII